MGYRVYKYRLERDLLLFVRLSSLVFFVLGLFAALLPIALVLLVLFAFLALRASGVGCRIQNQGLGIRV